MPRLEFTPKTKRLALERSKGLCEASGPFYGRIWDDRCNKAMVKVEYDHFILASEGGSRDLDNCRAVCPESAIRSKPALSIRLKPPRPKEFADRWTQKPANAQSDHSHPSLS